MLVSRSFTKSFRYGRNQPTEIPEGPGTFEGIAATFPILVRTEGDTFTKEPVATHPGLMMSDGLGVFVSDTLKTFPILIDIPATSDFEALYPYVFVGTAGDHNPFFGQSAYQFAGNAGDHTPFFGQSAYQFAGNAGDHNPFFGQSAYQFAGNAGDHNSFFGQSAFVFPGSVTEPPPTYELARSSANVVEGNSVTISLSTTGLANSTSVPWTITGANVTAADLNLPSLTGAFTISANVANIVINVASDAIVETAETFTLTLNSVTPTVATSVTIIDGAIIPPVANFTANVTSGAAPLAVSFTDTSTNSPTAWAWDFTNDGSTDSTSQNPTHTYSSAGTYTVKMTATNAGGSNTVTKTNYITVGVVPVANFTANVTSGTTPLTVSFTDTTTGSPTGWAWDFTNDGSTDSTSQNPSHTYNSAGTYSVKLTANNVYGNNSVIKTNYITVTNPVPTSMELVFDTTLGTNTIDLPLDGTVNVVVDWGDGSPTESFTSPGQPTHTYATAGVYTVTISGTLSAYSYWNYYYIGNGDSTLVAVNTFGNIGLTNLSYAFWQTQNLQTLPNDLPTTVSNLNGTFYDSTFNIGNVSTWNTGNVTDMQFTFTGAYNFNQPIGNWNTSNVTSMSWMFDGAYVFDQAIGNWNTSKVTSMNNMFTNAPAFNKAIGNWNVGNVANTSFMFAGAETFNQTIGNWNVGNVTDMNGMFLGAAAFNQTIGNWNVSKVTNMTEMLSGAVVFNQNIGSWNTANVTNMSYLFSGALAFNQNIGSWDTAKVTTMAALFNRAAAFNQDISSWNTANVANMSQTFDRATSFNQNISSWNTGNVTTMAYMFNENTAFNQPIGVWNTSKVTNTETMFKDAIFNQPIGNWNVANVLYMGQMFANATAFNQNISTWCVSNIPFEPFQFSTGSPLTAGNKPLWGTCPVIPTANFTANTTSGAAPLTVSFTDTSTGAPTSWAWDFTNDGSTDSTAQNPSHTYSSAGTYSVKLTATNAKGSNTITKTNYITALTTPVANFTSNVTSGSIPLSVGFTDTSTNSPSSWAWDFTDDGSTDSTVQNPTAVYNTTGLFNVKMTATNVSGSNTVTKTDYITAYNSGTAPAIPGNWNINVIQASTATFSIAFNSDGSITTSGSTAGSSWPSVWVSPGGAGIGNNYYVKFVLGNGQAWDSGLVSGQAYQLNATRTVTWTLSATTPVITGKIYVFHDAACEVFATAADFYISASIPSSSALTVPWPSTPAVPATTPILLQSTAINFPADFTLNCSRKVGQPTVNVEILILPDGKIWCQTDGNLPGTFAYPAYWVSNFYTSPSRPLTPNLGSQYYIKFVLTSGQAWLGGLNSGQVYSMSVARSVYWGFSSTASATGTVYIYSDAGGTALVDSATFTVNGS